MYEACSSDSTDRFAPMRARCRRATFSSRCFGSTYTLFSYSLPRTNSSICASVWFANEFDITNDGWPVAQPRFTRRPSASRITRLPSGKMMWSTCGLMFSHWYWRVDATSISESKWPMLQTIALWRIAFM